MITPRFARFGTVGSTNDIALELARDGAPEGTVVIAERQLKGRGRRGRTWFDAPGQNVLMSAILAPNWPLSDYSKLSFAASLAVIETLSSACGLTAQAKWPNDVMVLDKKIAGILVEVSQCGDGRIAVIGMGLNVKQTQFPEDLVRIATSVALQGGACTDIGILAESVTTELFSTYALPIEEILRRWRKYMWGVGKQADVNTEGRVLRGTISDVDSDGALLLTDSAGITHKILAADAIHTSVNDSLIGG